MKILHVCRKILQSNKKGQRFIGTTRRRYTDSILHPQVLSVALIKTVLCVALMQ